MIDGKNYGPHSFIAQIRDLETHKPLKGVTVGDIGPKMAYDSSDNGFLRLDHYRIPRMNMLMKHSRVNGTYTRPPHAKMSYSAMVHVRSHMVRHQAMFSAYAMTTAIRYSAIRRQGEIKPNAGEVKILDYQTQQHRLLPQLARTFAFLFTGQAVKNIYLRVDEMAELHYVTSGLKAVVTHLAGEIIEQSRMSCGGHGYSKATNFSEIYGVAIGGCTYEGENMVMLQQLARYDVLIPCASFLTKHSLIDKQPERSYWQHILAFEWAARRQIMRAYERLVSLRNQGLSNEEAWNQNAVELNRVSCSKKQRVEKRESWRGHNFYQAIKYFNMKTKKSLSSHCKSGSTCDLFLIKSKLLPSIVLSKKRSVTVPGRSRVVFLG
ncbi:unnamed protein product [Cylicostephanus goldi]|uniref:Acyl-CoA oxidase C-terminal domain-containing protein n=1 Tax=Cylicostephanus goldi TaxID=71465 RepID=A0A3P6RPN4_CYLGO|nr:unnamed protein product [Cylicostephanus goldi]